MTAPDVLVVGGGPAGSTTAGLLAREGWHVLVVDRARFPRPKPCGECLNPGAVEALDRLGLLAAVQALAPARLDGWRLRGGAVEVAAGFGDGRHGLGVPRETLDQALLDAARARGAEVLEESRVDAVEAAAGSDGPRVTLRSLSGERRVVRPRLVVGADGLRSVVSRSLGLVRRSPRRKKVSLTFRLRSTPASPPGAVGDEATPREGVLDVEEGVTLGLAPVSADGTLWNATVVAEAARYGREVATDPEGFFRRVMRARTGEGRPGTGTAAGEDDAWAVEAGPWASGPFDWPARRCWAPGVILVGDAAGYYDPFTGQGIYRALRSAELATEAVTEALAAPGASWAPLAAYGAAWRRETRPAVWLQRAVDAVMAHPLLRRPVLRRLGATGGLASVIRVTGDIAAPTTLLHPRVWLGRWAA